MKRGCQEVRARPTKVCEKRAEKPVNERALRVVDGELCKGDTEAPQDNAEDEAMKGRTMRDRSELLQRRKREKRLRSDVVQRGMSHGSRGWLTMDRGTGWVFMG
ncbi:uncharacterized protein PADG_07108 [Paracoccidioides brasiliensis Pb18]|uniref:Uncharacterized protein n=1 Tax=Paracoccidioides brasiliensis (strain Pb18) TaxID=502780 RepID=C1GIM2_PARBD|nr:uncharacterized protein PADG_07108 [Paracoccidioides brasiliensis Pb18]EEH42289.2 hypothetical protein PADG_07108 [Paracoccidioides brasiliensis Pb18]